MCARWEGGGRTLMKPPPLIAKNWLAVGMHGECGDNSTTCPLRIFCTFDDCPQAQLGGSGGTAHVCVLLGLERHACKGSGGDRSGDRLARQLEETSALLAAGASSSLDFFPLGFFCFSDAFVSISSSSGRRVPPTRIPQCG